MFFLKEIQLHLVVFRLVAQSQKYHGWKVFFPSYSYFMYQICNTCIFGHFSPMFIDKKPLKISDGMNLVACPDGRQLLMIMKISKKDAGIYECVATNNLASVTTSCILTLACKHWQMLNI